MRWKEEGDLPGTVLAMKDLVPGKPSITGKHRKRRGFCVPSPSVSGFGLLLSRRGTRVLGQEVLIHPKGRRRWWCTSPVKE